jgi:hypothetical protein
MVNSFYVCDKWGINYVKQIELGYIKLSHSPLDPSFAGSIPTEVDGFLRVIKIRSTTSFGGEVKPSVPCRRFTACNRTLRNRNVP